MSLTPPPPVTRRDWTLPIIAGVLAIVVVLAACMVATAVTFVALRREPGAVTDEPAPSVIPTQLAVKPGPDCLIGDWLETNYRVTIDIGGTNVSFSGKGAVYRWDTDGSFFELLPNVVYNGSSGGKQYEIVANGSMLLDYQANATTISYSNPTVQGTSVLKIDGVVSHSEALTASLTPETYTCQDNQLRLSGEDFTTELQRI